MGAFGHKLILYVITTHSFVHSRLLNTHNYVSEGYAVRFRDISSLRSSSCLLILQSITSHVEPTTIQICSERGISISHIQWGWIPHTTEVGNNLSTD